MSQRHDLEHQSKGKFASFALHVFSVQRFYNSTHKPRDTWLEKYTYRTVDEIECGEQRSLMSPPSTLSAQEKVSDLQDVDTNNQVGGVVQVWSTHASKKQENRACNCCFSVCLITYNICCKVLITKDQHTILLLSLYSCLKM